MKKIISIVALLTSFSLACAQSETVTRLQSCPNGLLVTLKSKFLGSCKSPSGNNAIGYYYRYSLEVENRSGQSINQQHNANFNLHGVQPFNIACLDNDAGLSISFAISAHEYKPYEIREVIQFDLMFYDKYDNTQVISNSKLFAQNVCGSSTGTSGATSSRSTSQLTQTKGQDKSATQKKADELEKAGKYDEAKKVWDQYEVRHPEDADLAGSKRKDIHTNMNNKAQAARDVKQKQETAALAATMITFGAIMYKGLGNDKGKNKYAERSWRLNFSCGYSIAFMPVYMNSVSSIYNGSGTNTYFDAESKTVGTVNIDLGFQFWPYYGKNAGVGLIADGYGGYIPIGGSTFGYLYQYGAQAYAGANSIKGIFSYTMGDKGFSTVQKFSSGTYDDASTGEGGAKFTRMMGGIRISINTNTHPVHHFDLSYIMESYNNMKKIKGNGFNLTYSAHNRLKIYGEYMFTGARIGVIEPDFTLDAKNTGFYIRFGVIRSMDWFKQ